MNLVDSHCHLDDPRFDLDREAVLERARKAGVDLMLTIGSGYGPEQMERAIRLAESHQGVLATVGVHPHDAAKADGATWSGMERLLAHQKVVALGEIGLDYYYDLSPREQQRAVFAEQLHLARSAGKPIVVHTREAWTDTWRLLEEHWTGSALPGIMHCFSGGPEEARRALDLGFWLAFGGVVTFQNAAEVRAAALLTPLDRILVETDAPYLAPAPKRGRRNEPAFVVETARKLSEIRGEPLEVLAAATTASFAKLCLPRQSANGYTGTSPWS
jgi:TatD DNase family protein